MKKSTIGVLGVGEVGSAIIAIFNNKFTVLKKDLNFDEIKDKKIEILHVCIPYSKKFISVVTSQIKINNPKLVIIHSTVRPTTTSQIFNITNILIVHSPVMGLHPTLKEDILRFTKFVGPVNQKSARLTKKHFSEVGIKVAILNNTLESEIGKLLDTTYYAWNIIFCKLVGELCQELKVDFAKVYTQFNEVYNLGYGETKPNVIRPILKFEKGAIGGSCLIPNAKIFNDFKSSSLTEFLLKTNKALGKKK
jgi:UDP-N-acetyl-D-mannosaminuronate dehydrogenase